MKMTCSPGNGIRSQNEKQKHLKKLSLPVLELTSDAVEHNTHGVVGVHENLVDESLKSLVQISKDKLKKTSI